MSKYTVEWAEVIKEGRGQKGPWKLNKMSLKDEQGNTIENVQMFGDIMPGEELEGNIVKNTQYGSMEFKRTLEKPNFMRKTGEILRAVKEKQVGIAESQALKAKNIAAAQDRNAWMWAKTNASTLKGDTLATLSNEEIAAGVLDLATKIYNGEPTEPFS